MQLKAKLIECLPLQTGTSKNGEWKKQDIILETEGQYPKKVCVSIWGDKINNNVLQVGKELVIDINIESRAYNNKWYTDVKAWKIQLAEEDKVVEPESLSQKPLIKVNWQRKMTVYRFKKSISKNIK